MMQQSASSKEQNSLNFLDLQISSALKESINDLGYKSLTSFQKEIFKLTQEENNVIAFGQSSYGKSLAFNLPLLQSIDSNSHETQGLVVTQNQLQAEIVKKEINALGKKSLISANIYGQEQTAKILICTTEDLMNDSFDLDFQNIKTIFIDNLKQADIKKALEKISKENQSFLWLIFSQENIQSLKQDFDFLNSAHIVENADKPKLIKPSIHIIHQQNEAAPKPKTLLAVLEYHKNKNYLVSCNEENCNILAKFLSRYGYKVQIACNVQPYLVKRRLEELLDNKIEILVCQNNLLENQDVGAVEFLINYDLPERTQDYEKITHFEEQKDELNRKLINIVSSRELNYLTNIKSQYQINFEHKTLPTDEEVVTLITNRIIANLSQQAKETEVSQFDEIAAGILNSEESKQILSLLLKNNFIQNFESSIKREDNTPKDLLPRGRDFNDRYTKKPQREFSPRNPPLEAKEEKEEIKETEQQQEEDVEIPSDGTARIYISLGQKDGFDDLADLAHYLSEKSNVDMGHFCGVGMVRDQSSHIEVDEEVAQAIIDAMNNQDRPNTEISGITSPIICERAKQQTYRPRFQKKPYRRRNIRR